MAASMIARRKLTCCDLVSVSRCWLDAAPGIAVRCAHSTHGVQITGCTEKHDAGHVAFCHSLAATLSIDHGSRPYWIQVRLHTGILGGCRRCLRAGPQTAGIAGKPQQRPRQPQRCGRIGRGLGAGHSETSGSPGCVCGGCGGGSGGGGMAASCHHIPLRGCAAGVRGIGCRAAGGCEAGSRGGARSSSRRGAAAGWPDAAAARGAAATVPHDA